MTERAYDPELGAMLLRLPSAMDGSELPVMGAHPVETMGGE